MAGTFLSTLQNCFVHQKSASIMKQISCCLAAISTIALAWLATPAYSQMCFTREAEVRTAKNAPLDTNSTRGVIDNFFLWNIGRTISVGFLNGTPEQQARVMRLAKEWEKYANLKFQHVQQGNTNIRVEFSNKQDNYSFIGTYANQITQDKHTMHLEFALFADSNRLRRTVIHEFGHAIGLLHEHSNPISGIQWNKDTMYKEYARGGWDKNTVDAQVFRVYNARYTNGTSYDPKSIMHYPIPRHHTLNGYSVDWNTDISEGDKKLVGMMYPFSGERPNQVTQAMIEEYTTTIVKADPVAGGLNLYPSFVVATEGIPGNVVFAIMLFDKQGNGIKAISKEYNINGTVGAYRAFRLGPGNRLNANKKSPDDFNIFIPYSSIPEAYRTEEVQVQFRGYVSDDVELKNVYTADPISFRLNAK